MNKDKKKKGILPELLFLNILFQCYKLQTFWFIKCEMLQKMQMIE